MARPDSSELDGNFGVKSSRGTALKVARGWGNCDGYHFVG